jgi:hypothetical protein
MAMLTAVDAWPHPRRYDASSETMPFSAAAFAATPATPVEVLAAETLVNETIKYLLDESRIPRFWYNIAADLPSAPPPVLHPGTLKSVTASDLSVLFPEALIEQEVSTEREIEIPEPELAMALAGLPAVPA